MEKEGTSSNRKFLLPGIIVAVAATAAVGFFAWPPDTAESTTADDDATPPTEAVEPEFDTLVERGEWLYANRGCTACHGEAGAGGVVNENYVLDTVPALDEMADRLMLFEPEDAEIAVGLIQEGGDLAAHRDDAPFPGYVRFLAQYEVVVGVMENGAEAAKKEESGPTPPLQMPAWGEVLGDDGIRAVVAYLITQYDWDALDEEDEDEFGAAEGEDDYDYGDDYDDADDDSEG